ncbi:MAG: histidine phosphatase family protein [Candidatus Tectimicrobiota bacterium]
MDKAWLGLASALTLILCTTLASAQQAVILIRHAELQGAAMAEPKYIPLSETGQERAGRLAQLLHASGIGAIYVTDFTRTQQTATPLARALKQEATIMPKGDPQELVKRLQSNHSDQTVLIVGHTDTLPGLLKALGHPADISIDAADYGNIFVLLPRGERAPTFLLLRY